MGKAYIGETVLVQEEQIINNAPTKVLTLNEDDEITVSEIGNVRGVESVAGDLVDNTDPKNPVVNEKKDLPEDFFISCTYNCDEENGNELTYLTDELTKINIRQYVPNDIYATYEISVIDGNVITIIGQLKSEIFETGNYFILSFIGSYIQSNRLVLGLPQYREIPELIRDSVTDIPNNIHGMDVMKGYLYCVTRADSNGTATQLIKFNPYNISDFKIISLPTTTGYLGETTDIIAYVDKLYILPSNSTVAPSYLISIDENLENHEILFSTLNPDSSMRVRKATAFLIYNNYVFIPTVRNTPAGQGKIGISKYSLFKKTIDSYVIDMPINANNVGSAIAPYAHWMSAYGGKLFIQTAAGGENQSRSLIRINPNDLSVEASTPIPYAITNGNTITKDGYIYLNPENNCSAKLIKIKVNFEDNDVFEEVGEEGFYSLGSPKNKIYNEALPTKLSQFGEWDKVTQSVSVNGGDPVFPDPITGNLDLTVSGGGGGATNLSYTASPTNGTVNSDTGTDAIIPLADNTNAGLMPANFYVVYPETAYTETVTWGGTAPVTMQNSTWQATKIGNRLSLRMNINYATAGTGNTTAQVPLPTGVPLPSSITGFTNNNSYMAVGSAAVSTGITSNPTISRAVLRRETGTTYSVYNTFSSGAYNTIIIDIEYFTD